MGNKLLLYFLSAKLNAQLEGAPMTIEELMLRLICLEQQLRKQNFRLHLLETGRQLQEKPKKAVDAIQLDLFEAAM